MKCSEIKNLIPLYTDNKLQPLEMQKVSLHTSVCPACRKKLGVYRQMWALLGKYKDITPRPGFVSKFWTRLAARESWQQEFFGQMKHAFASARLAFQVTTVCLILIMAGIFISRYYHQSTVDMLASLSEAEIEMVDDIELAQQFDVIENLDFYEDLDIIERIQG